MSTSALRLASNMLEAFLAGYLVGALVSVAFLTPSENRIVLGLVRIARAKLTGGYLSIGEGPRHERILVRNL